MSTRPSANPFPIVAWLDRRTPWQRRLFVVVVGLVILFLLARLVGRITMDYWWLESVSDADVWSTMVGAQVLMGVMALVMSAVVVVGSAWFAHRTSPAEGNRPNRLVVAYRQRMGPAHGWILIGAAILTTVRAGAAAMNRWKPWLLFVSGPDLDTPVPDVGWDLGYHLFRLPFLELASGWIRLTVIYGLLFAVVGYVANGALKLPRRGRRSAPRALVHLALGVALFSVLQALDYIFVRWPDNATSRFGAFDGAGFTQIHFIIPSLGVLAGVALITAIVTVQSARSKRWRPAFFAFAVWGLLQVILIGLIPNLITRFVVEPAEATRQLPYISNNLEATQESYGLTSVDQVTRVVADGLDSPPPEEVEPQLDSMPVFSEASLIQPLQVLQGTTGTRITDVDLDRYEIDGERRPVLIAARNAFRADLPEKGWVQEHLVYTHGDGVVAVPADSTSPDGRPDVDAFTSQLEGVPPELYFGEQLNGWYVVVGTDVTEVGGSVYNGGGAIEMNSVWRRLALSLTVGEVDPLFSAELGPDSRLLYRRGVIERLSSLAPFLSFDANPYPVVADGRITWVVDGYTTSSSYPYSQFARNLSLPAGSGLARALNYVHASVKATIDAYDGTVHLYRTEVGGAVDPVLDAWSAIFPGLIEPISDMPSGLKAHLLYPQDMLTVQTAMLGRYHVSDAETLFNGSDSWAISVSAGDQVAGATTGAEDKTVVPAPAVSLFMPSTEPLGNHWVAIRPYGPGSAANPTSTRDELSALAIADHDNPENLLLVRIEVDSGRLVSSPGVAQAAIDTDSQLAERFTLLNANGSKVQFGPLTPIPLEGALVWARSIVVNGTADTTAPRLYEVVAVSNGLVGQADTTTAALTVAVEAGS
jgi:uncharacterized membrane protein (UPF0182 family)